jgi:endonuclease YncB( thermonuclease family)
MILRFLKWWGVMALTLALVAVACSSRGETAKWVHIRWVIDGDTVILDDGRRIRYLGINAPEINHKNQQGQPYAFVAKRFNRKLVTGRRIRLEFGPKKKDRYGRVLAYLFLADGTFVNRELLARGYGYFYPTAIPGKYDHLLLKTQRTAMAAGIGIWKKWRQPVNGAGYIGNRRSRRFHRVNCRDGKKISRKHRRRFTSMWEAFEAGFAPAKGCIDGRLGWHVPK